MLRTELRLPDDLAAVLRIAAAARRQSQHAYVLAAIRAAILRDAHAAPTGPVAAGLATVSSPSAD